MSEDSPRAEDDTASAAQWRAVVAAIAGVWAGWIAAGSTGLVGYPLQRTLTLVGMAVAVASAWPGRNKPSGVNWCIAAAALVGAILLNGHSMPAVNVLAVAMLLATLARMQSGTCGGVILTSALAVAVLGLFRLACASIPVAWLAADRLGYWLGLLGGLIAGKPLSVGATFAGLDFLVLAIALYAAWLTQTTRPRLGRAIFAIVAIVVGQLIYLFALANCREIISALPEAVKPDPDPMHRLGVWAWGNASRTMLPWNLPLLAGLILSPVFVIMFRWSSWRSVNAPNEQNKDKSEELPLAIDMLLNFGPGMLAVAIPMIVVLALGESRLNDKTVVVHQTRQLDFSLPSHDVEIDLGYGMLRPLVKSLGGEVRTSHDLSEQDLATADVLMLIDPTEPLSEKQLQRVWKFVDDGGSLLVASGPRTIADGDPETPNSILEPTSMRIRHDTAVCPVRNWEHACMLPTHPVVEQSADTRNRLGLYECSSISVGWPTGPLAVGRFAFSDPGSDAAATGRYEYEPGERLGDLVLAAEQSLGQGRVCVLGYTRGLDNDGIPAAHAFDARLLSYLAGNISNPRSWWRQLLGMAAFLTLVGLLYWHADATRLGIAVAILAVSVVLCVKSVHEATRVLPNGEGPSRAKVAYIDASHLEAYSSDSESPEGLGGLYRMLMDNGYLPLMLPKVSSERLAGADMLISIAPSRTFSKGEIDAVEDFVNGGGHLICTVGAEHTAGSRELLDRFEFSVPPSPLPADAEQLEPEPMGWLNTRYYNAGDYYLEAWFYSAWPIEYSARNADVLTRGWEDRPIAVSRPFAAGSVTVVGDTYNLCKDNLLPLPGEPPENLHYWRWLISRVTSDKEWIPPNPNPPKDDGEKKDVDKPTEKEVKP